MFDPGNECTTFIPECEQKKQTELMATLEEVPVGQSVRICEILGDDAIAIRLMEMGLTEGEMIRVQSVAPMGDPIEYEIRGYRLSLRRNEARRVQVEMFA